ncbi:translation elongation factor 4 [Candidatus Phytoplasma bonamiae]|uniref:Elongation factor 4 n=1 Tax=Candidatus Phytoplasma bonamiae TaxID=2982626 RepID=A0ABT9D4G4_9MOLU|nr:translation elongation factor 4 ['Bonamia sp.' little leaf phytoplasma]MDO8063866.1 translation elongation factor 4 ['Bonamia sp.' little leaf phytoplasma]MDV3174658.1 translation elongation factor 4 ['Bonamia sp.' little leaf phytoplasma]
MDFDKIKKRQKQIRNFSIIAHIDHGKSTLADRILEITNTVKKHEMKPQFLDSMALEQERGITIKLNAIQIKYNNLQNKEYIMHLIDTPGHSDFRYEVSRSLAACEGALLVVDATQGIQSQTISNLELALENKLIIIPVINKIDSPNANIPKIQQEIRNLLKIDINSIILASGKTGIGIQNVLEKIITNIPYPKGNPQAPLQALIFDSKFNNYKGVIPHIRIINGTIKKGDRIRFIKSKAVYDVIEVGTFQPNPVIKPFLTTGDVGYLTAFIKNIDDVKIGDTITLNKNIEVQALPGYKIINPVVFCGFYPAESKQYINLQEALQKLKLNDSSLIYEKSNSNILGMGFRIGCLGLLHMDIIKERITREFQIEVIITAPSVIFHVYTKQNQKIIIDNLQKWPQNQAIEKIEEPFIKAFITCPEKYIGSVMKITQNKRGILHNIKYLENQNAILTYLLPFGEIIYDYFDQLKSTTQGYATFDYQMENYYPSKLKKMDILLNSEIVDALSLVVHEDFAYTKGKIICNKLKELIPKQMFEITIQAALGKKIITRENIKALRKNVTDKCYGGDHTRKKKLLEKQKAGKKKMRALGKVKLPQQAFLAILANK